MGDFNCSLNPDFDIISGQSHDESEIEALNETLNTLELTDVWRTHHPTEKGFTWSRLHPFIARRLDYCFLSENILPLCTTCEHLINTSSDHKAVSIELGDTTFKRGPGYWRFNNSYLKNTTFVEKLNEILEDFLAENRDLDSVTKWEMCKVEIRNYCTEFGKRTSCQKRNESLTLELQMQSIEKVLKNDPQNKIAVSNYMKVKQKLELLQIEKTRGAQVRARLRWIEEGEKNSKYFCNLEKVRSKKRLITRLRTETGDVITDQKEILQEQVAFYKKLYNQKTDVLDVKQAANTFMGNEVFEKLNEDESISCEGTITLDETTSALSQMNNGSAPGSDGLTIEFLKFFWNKLGKTITNSFTESFNIGELSFTQRQGILTLIHKGKELDRDELNNWRPITLTNSDYKILAKVLARRLGNVVSKLINEDQVGYIKGRNISTVLRTIDDTINYLNHTGKAGYLLALDYRKAFDSLSKSYLLHVFDVFGFGPDFQRWVHILTNNSQSCINHGGWLSEPFDVNCGIRQGCPFSPLAFVLAVELLAVKIRSSPITGIKTPSAGLANSISLKIKQLADDTTLFLNGREDMVKSMNILETFERFSGLKLNFHKTKALRLGRGINEHDLPFSVVDKIKILGIYFQADKMAKDVEENWKGRIESIEKTIQDWSKRDLSIHGKILITKTFLMSQLTYIMQSIGIPESVLKKINTLLYKFVWQRKYSNRRAFEKVKRKVMESDYDKGGLNMVNMMDTQHSAYLQWAGKLFSTTEENWSVIPKWHLSKIINNKGIFMINCRSNKIKNINDIQNDFWKQVIMTYADHKISGNVKAVTPDNFQDQLLFYNDFIQYKGKHLYFQKWKEKRIEYVKDIIHATENRLLTLEEIETLLGYRRANTLFEYNALQNAIPTSWLEWIHEGRILRDTHQPDTCEAKGLNKQLKDIKKLQRKNKTTSVIPCANLFWHRKLNFELDKNVWLSPRVATKETRLRELQWKINHNIYPTNILLHKMKVTETNRCDNCPTETDFMEHFFFDCPPVHAFWKQVETLLSMKTETTFRLSLTDVLFGTQRCQLSRHEQTAVNHVLLIGKMCISIARKTKKLPALQMIFEQQLHLRKNSIPILFD